MARIPDETIELLKQTIALERLAEARGVILKRHGADLIGCCPFHDDKSPSLVITPAKNLWHCLGACQCGGTVIDWVMRAEGVSFRHAVELLQNHYLPSSSSSLAASSAAVIKRATVRKLPAPIERSDEDEKLLGRVIEYYHQTLLTSPEALAYLDKRGINNAEAIATFKLGFANRTLGYRLPEKNRQEGAQLRGQLQRIGLYRSSGHEHFNGSLVIPVISAAGEVTEVYGRKITAGLREGTPLHLYLPGTHRGVWNAAALGASKDVILCESLIDALTFWCAGLRNVTASYGVEGFTAEHLAAFKQHGIERVFIAYDRDEAGDRAAENLAKQLMAEGLECYRVLFPKGIDANEYALKVTPAAQSLGLAIRSAHWLGNGAKRAVGEAAAPSNAVPNPSPAPQTAALNPSLPPSVEPSPSLAAAAAEPMQVHVKQTELATPLPAAVADAVVSDAPEALLEVREHELLLVLDDRRWRVRGLPSEPTPGQLKVNLLLSRSDRFHVDTLDLYCARLRGAYVKQASVELGLPEELIKRDLGAVLLKLEALQAQRLEEAQRERVNAAQPKISLEDKAAALALLHDPRLTERILEDLTVCGVVGEDTNKLVAYLGALSRKLDSPLALVIQSLSGAGKSALMDAVLELMPEEERMHYSAMTGQSLFYLGSQDMRHKILAIAEEAGVREASYALKLLQSQGELTIASTGKDAVSGKLVTHTYRVEGPVMLFLTTTAIDLDEELANRCLVLTVNESREQTRAIQQRQRYAQTLEGLLGRETRRHLQNLHRNAQRLLRPLRVVNPFAPSLTFLDDRTRTRRDHQKYLTLIRASALLHQYQREVKTVEHRGELLEYIEATAQDIALANRLAHQVLGQSLDALPPQTRALLKLLHAMVSEQARVRGLKIESVRFTRREAMTFTHWSYEQLRVHMERLAELDYVLVHGGARGQRFTYELLWRGEGEDGNPFLLGLTDPESATTTRTLGGAEGDFGVGLLPGCGAVVPGLLGEQTQANLLNAGSSLKDSTAEPQNRTSPANSVDASYRSGISSLAASSADSPRS